MRLESVIQIYAGCQGAHCGRKPDSPGRDHLPRRSRVTAHERDYLTSKALTTRKRKALGKNTFAVPGKRKLPLNDPEHVRKAAQLFDKTQGLTPSEKKSAKSKIRKRAKQVGVKTTLQSRGLGR